MDHAEFSKSLGKTVESQKQEESAKAKQRQESHESTRQIIIQVKPLIDKYKASLEGQGIDVKAVVAGDRGDLYVLEMNYTQGGYYGFDIHDSLIRTRFKEDGKAYTASGSCPSIRNGVDLPAFESFLQETMRRFMSNAPKYGGFLKP
jgi:hypothetical protein